MSDGLQLFTLTVPAGTVKSTPATLSIPIGIATIDSIRWRVPPGPRGNLGWYLAMGGLQVLPEGQGNYVVADDESDTWDLAGLPDEGEWQMVGYNTGRYSHTVYLWVRTTPLPAPAGTPAPTIIPAGQLSSASQ